MCEISLHEASPATTAPTCRSNGSLGDNIILSISEPDFRKVDQTQLLWSIRNIEAVDKASTSIVFRDVWNMPDVWNFYYQDGFQISCHFGWTAKASLFDSRCGRCNKPWLRVRGKKVGADIVIHYS